MAVHFALRLQRLSSKRALDEIQVTVIYSRFIFVAVPSMLLIRGLLYNLDWDIWNTEKSADPDQAPQNAASDQGMHFSIKNYRKFRVKWNSFFQLHEDVSNWHSKTIDPPMPSVLWCFHGIFLLSRWHCGQLFKRCPLYFLLSFWLLLFVLYFCVNIWECIRR